MFPEVIMKKTLCLTLLLLFSSVIASADSLDQYRDLLKKVDSLVTFRDTDLSAEYTISKRDPGGSTSITVAAMFRRDRTDQFLILILEPAPDKGKGYLKIGDNLWLYDPVSRSFTFTSARERFQNSSARNSDFNRSNYYNDYKVVAAGSEILGRFNTAVLDLEAVSSNVSFPKVKLWISEDKLVRKIEDYSLSGQLMRTTAVPTYQKTGDRWLPATLVIVDHLVSKVISGKTEYERTTITIRNPSIKALPDSVYTKEYLERISR